MNNIMLFLFGSFVGMAFFVGFVSLIINYRRLDKESRKPYFIILFSYVIGLAGVYYSSFLAPALAGTIFNSPEYYTPVILVTLIPISFTYSIFKYQLMDITVFVKNAVTYGAATLTVAAIYFLVIYVLGQSISSAIGTEYQGIIAGLIFVAFALLFQSTKDKFQDFITRRFYPEQFIHQKVLMKFSNDVSTVVGVDNIIDSMQETFVDALKIDTFGILMKHDQTNSFKLVRSTGLSKEKCEISNSQIAKFVAEKQITGNFIVIDRNDFDSVFPFQAEGLKEENIYTIIPMLIKGKVLGLLLFGLKYSGSQFAGKDLELLCASANQTAISLENARLYESEADKLKLEIDLDLARKIQQSLLPKSIPKINGLDICGEMFPAMQVGGDYFDFIPVSDKKLFVIVGDVSGKGLSASLYMTKIQTMVQITCMDNKTPADILVEINRRLYQTIERRWFVTMTIALFDMEKETVTVCRAGHVPLLKALNGSVAVLRSGGLGVGLEKGVIFERTLNEYILPLKKGELYAFFSDGITEAMNEDSELFGEDKLSELLKNKTSVRSAEVMNDIWKDLEIYRGNAEQNDDMTMVLVKVK
ncbi:MAG: SpoIIE family protein phosphatase [Ignavibacteriaceae bacterium]|nr:SpoIIE family protein phosphatase [Ignavibacteriaceae bacterium]